MMKRIFNKWDRFKLGHKLHQLQKRYGRAINNGTLKNEVSVNRT